MNGHLRLLSGGDVVEFSRVYLTDSKLIAKSGPLVGMEDLVNAVDKRKMRAKIMIPFMDRLMKLKLK